MSSLKETIQQYEDYVNSGQVSEYDQAMNSAYAAAGDSAIPFYGQSAANQANVYLNRANNAFNAEQSQIQRDFTKYMAENSYSMAIKDLEKNGINPYYLFNGGSGSGAASGGSGSSASSSGGSSISSNNNARELISSFVRIAAIIATAL